MATHTDNGGTFLFFINEKLNISFEKRIHGVNDGMEVTVIKVENFIFLRAFLSMTIEYAELREKV